MQKISGIRLIADFFSHISETGADPQIAENLRKLHEEGNFTDKKIDNMLLGMRENHDKN